MIWHEVQYYTAGPLPRNGAGSLADGKPWVSIPLSRNGFTMSTRVTFLAFGLSTNRSLTLLISWLLALFARSALCIMANRTCVASQHSPARPIWSVYFNSSKTCTTGGCIAMRYRLLTSYLCLKTLTCMLLVCFK